ncbi:hypothetical protein FRC17_005175 [Serendipita sp. 399]|nr:hypothetical protein FRC17_005175 [Serendipita sp. 399]
MTNAIVDIYGFIHHTPSTTTTTTAATPTNSPPSTTMTAPTAAAAAAPTVESEPTEISEADFLARVAAFERNEQLEAQRVRTKVSRWTQQQQQRGGERPAAQSVMGGYERWNPHKRRDDEDEDDENNGTGYSPWKAPVDDHSVDDEYRQPPPLSHSHRHQPRHAYSPFSLRQAVDQPLGGSRHGCHGGLYSAGKNANATDKEDVYACRQRPTSNVSSSSCCPPPPPLRLPLHPRSTNVVVHIDDPLHAPSSSSYRDQNPQPTHLASSRTLKRTAIVPNLDTLLISSHNPLPPIVTSDGGRKPQYTDYGCSTKTKMMRGTTTTTTTRSQHYHHPHHYSHSHSPLVVVRAHHSPHRQVNPIRVAC